MEKVRHIKRKCGNVNRGEIESRYEDRIPNAKTRAALDEKTTKARRHKSSAQVLKSLKA